MENPITLFDYNADWAMTVGYLDPKPVPGFMTREEVIDLFRVLKVDGAEIREDYWGDCSPAYLKKITSDTGLPINRQGFWRTRNVQSGWLWLSGGRGSIAFPSEVESVPPVGSRLECVELWRFRKRQGCLSLNKMWF